MLSYVIFSFLEVNYKTAAISLVLTLRRRMRDLTFFFCLTGILEKNRRQKDKEKYKNTLQILNTI